MPRSSNKRKDGKIATKRRPLYMASREYKELLAMCTKLYVTVSALEHWVNDFTKANEEARKRSEDASKIVVPGGGDGLVLPL